MATKIMFLCTGNSARSQMAEGWARHLGGTEVEVYSAGVEPKGINPRAVQVMREAGIDIGGQTSKTIDPELLRVMDVVVTLCGDARDRCPVTPAGIRRLHWPLPDPAAEGGTNEEMLGAFRRVRDEIRDLVKSLLDDMRPGASG